MRKTLFLILIFLPVWTVAQTQDDTHTVKAGETLFSISRQYDVSVEQLRDWNNLSDNSIQVGQRLFISERDRPATEEEDTAVTDTTTHVVQAGQTLFRIARLYDVNVDDIRSWNDLESDALSLDQELIIVQRLDESSADDESPASAELQEPDVSSDADADEASGSGDSALYEVRPGDTLFRIASRYNMSVEELMDLNDLDDATLVVGEQLRVRSRPAPPPSVADEWDMESTPQGKFVNYTISEQDSIEQLLQFHQMDRYDFRELNPGLSLSDVRPGDEVTLLLSATSSQQNPYRVETSTGHQTDRIEVSRYSDDRRGTTTTSGDLYNPSALTAAHPALALGSVVYVENPETGRGIFVLINDRTPDNQLLLSASAFQALQYSGSTQLLARIHENISDQP